MDTTGITYLQKQAYSLDPIGSLLRVRTILGDMHFSSKQEEQQYYDLVGYAHLACFNLAEENGTYAAFYFGQSANTSALREVYRLAHVYEQEKTMELLRQLGVEKPIPELHSGAFWMPSFPRNVSAVDTVFRQYCEEHSLVILRTLQKGIESIRRCSWVYLVWDKDGIVKVYKEVLDYRRGPLGSLCQNEDELYGILPDNPYFPHVFETISVGPIQFMRQSVHFGQTVADYIDSDHRIPLDQVRFIMQGVAEAIQYVHDHDIAYLDIKPENIMVDSSGVRMVDLGISRKVNGNELVDIYLADPRFGTPECGKQLKGSKASDIFQMGVLYHMLVTGKHPFERVPFEAQDLSIHRESAILRYFWPTTVCSYKDMKSLFDDVPSIIGDMLEADPDKRPTAGDVAKELAFLRNFTFIPKSWKSPRQKIRNTVLFPARMGIPHKGHIEYIRRLLELGYHVLISIQRSHTITDRDPIPKSFVMKMVAQSLMACGFRPDADFSFILTPFYRTNNELEYHYMTMPQIDDVIAVASSNPGVHDFFSGWAIFDQTSVFGSEGAPWEDLSWGEILRKAVRDRDYKTFQAYAAGGVEKILTFSEIHAMYGQPEIEFAHYVEAVLVQNGKELSRGRIFRYQTPEQSIVTQLRGKGWKVTLGNPYVKDTILDIDGTSMKLVYIRTEFVPETGHESIYFKLVDP